MDIVAHPVAGRGKNVNNNVIIYKIGFILSKNEESKMIAFNLEVCNTKLLEYFFSSLTIALAIFGIPIGYSLGLKDRQSKRRKKDAV
jgi:hypothetical protein